MPISFIKKWMFESEMSKPLPISTGDGRDIGVMTIYNADNGEIEAIRKYISSHIVDGTPIHILSYAHQKEAVASDSTYTLKDISWAGYPKSEIINKFISHKFKRFYYLCPSFDDHQRFILSKINADFKAGVYSPVIEQYLDLTIDNPFISTLESIKEIYTTISKLRNQKT